MRNVPIKIERILTVANELSSKNLTEATVSELIAAAFILERLEFLPYGYNIVEAWERLGDTQELVKEINKKYRDLLVPW